MILLIFADDIHLHSCVYPTLHLKHKIQQGQYELAGEETYDLNISLLDIFAIALITLIHTNVIHIFFVIRKSYHREQRAVVENYSWDHFTMLLG